jgi:hypothetical protein
VRLREVERVQSEKGGTDFVLDEFGDLILAHELRLDGGHIPRAGVVPGAGELICSKEGVYRRIAIAVQKERHVHIIDLFHHAVGEVLWKGRLAFPVLFTTGATGEIGGGEECGPTLR